MTPDLPPLRKLLPHRPPSLLIRRVVDVRRDGISAVGTVPARHPLVAKDGFCPAILAVEMGAQAAAALEALDAVPDGDEPRIGYLVGIGQVRLEPGMPAGAPMNVRVRREASAGPLTRFSIRVWSSTGEWASGVISTYLPAQDPRHH